MNPIHLTARNLRTFEQLDLELPAGCVVIGGDNGAGKSTLLNAIDVALFCGRGELPPLLTLGEEELALELTFEHGGELYRVRRGYSGKSRGKTTLDLEQRLVIGNEHGPDAWDSLTRETAEATQQHLEQILGLSRATFRASSFLAQGDGAAFTEASPRDRKAILAEILGLEVWDRLLEHARGELRVAEDGTVAARARIAQLDEQLAGDATLTADLAAARGELADRFERKQVADALLEQARRRQADNAAAVERARAAKVQLDTAADARERARQQYADSINAAAARELRQAELDQAAAEADTVPVLESTLAGLQEQRARAEQLAERTSRLRAEAEQRELANSRMGREVTALREQATLTAAKADHLEQHIGEAGSCGTCGQTLGAEAAARAAASYRAEAAEINERVAPLAEAVAAEQQQLEQLADELASIFVPVPPDTGEVEQRLRVARAAGEKRATLAEQVRQLAELAARSGELAIALADADDEYRQRAEQHTAAAGNVADTDELQHAVIAARNAVDIADAAATEARAAVTRLETLAERLEQARQERDTVAGSLELELRRIDVLKLAEKAYGRDGIPALIVENAAIPQLELEANRILGELGGATGDCRIELRTQRALKTTEVLRETLDIIIVTPAGERAYETFSGGERTRLNLSLRIALARLLAHRRGADSRLLAIDEPEFLDEHGVGRLADVLRGLSGDFDRVLLVSHHPTLATSFDRTLLVVRRDGCSRVDVGELEAVAA